MRAARKFARLASLPSDQAEHAVAASVSSEAQDDPSPFFDGFLRSFLLGLGIGCLFEAAHVSVQLFSTLQQVGLPSLSETVSGSLEQFAPAFVQDHVAAILGWLLLYGAEVAAIIKVLDRFQGDTEGASRALGSTVTLPRKMLPLPLSVLKRLILAGRGHTSLAAAAAAASSQGAGPSAVDATRAFVDAVGQRTSGGAGIAQEQGTKPRVGPMDLPTPPPATVPRAGNVIPIPPLRRGAPLPPGGPQDDEDEDQDKRQRQQLPRSFLGDVDEGSLEDDLATRRSKRSLAPGQLDPASSRWARRQQELAQRRMYLKEQWYCAALAQEVVPGKPHGVEMLGMKVMLMRDAQTNQVRCISDVCPHRGAPLSKGWLEEHGGHTCVVCPYHAWAIDAEGKLRDVPAAEKAVEWTSLGKVVPTYHVEEKGGFVWLYFGTNPAELRPPIPYVDELDEPTWECAYGEIEFDAPHWGVFENATDFAHIHTVHSTSFGNSEQPEIKNMKAVTDPYSVTASFDLHNKPVNQLWEFSKVPEVHVTAKALLPSTSYIAFTLGNGLSFITFVNTVPIDEHRTINRFCLVRKLDVPGLGPLFNAKAWNRIAVESMKKILTEDKGMVEYLRPDLLPREISVKADLAQTAFRKLRQAQVDAGNGVLPEQTHEIFRGDF